MTDISVREATPPDLPHILRQRRLMFEAMASRTMLLWTRCRIRPRLTSTQHCRMRAGSPKWLMARSLRDEALSSRTG
jgi:hypothetical protein